MKNNISLCQRSITTQRQQVGISRTKPHQRNFSVIGSNIFFGKKCF